MQWRWRYEASQDLPGFLSVCREGTPAAQCRHGQTKLRQHGRDLVLMVPFSVVRSAAEREFRARQPEPVSGAAFHDRDGLEGLGRGAKIRKLLRVSRPCNNVAIDIADNH